MDGSTLAVGESFCLTDKVGNTTGSAVGKLEAYSNVGKIQAAILLIGGVKNTTYIRLTADQLRRYRDKERIIDPVTVPL